MIKMVKVEKLVDDVKSIRPDVETKDIIFTARVFPDVVLDKLDMDGEISEHIYSAVINFYKNFNDKKSIQEFAEEVNKVVFGCEDPVNLNLD